MDKTKISQKKVLKLINKISKLEPIEFMGLAKLLKVSMGDSQKESEIRDFYELLDELLEKYYEADKKTRKQIDKILNAVIKEK